MTMARPASKVTAAPSGATATPRASVGPPSAEARTAAFAQGANIDAMLAILRERLLEACHRISEILALLPDGDMRLRTLQGKLALAAGEIGLFSP